MQAATSARRVGTTVLAALAAVVLVCTAVYAAQAAAGAKPAVTVQLSPASQSVQRGQSALYSVTLTSGGGLAGPVTLTAAGLPAGAGAAFSPGSVTLAATGPGATATAQLTVSTTSATPVGTASLTITAASGKTTGSAPAGLTVTYPLSGALTMGATPATTTMDAGSTAVYTLALTRTNLTGPVTLGLAGALPAGASATFSPNPVTGASATVQVATSPTAPDGTATLYLVASGADASGVTRYAYASVQLVITTTSRPFTVSGDLAGALSPGTTLPLGLTLTNPNKKALSVTNLTVTIAAVTRTAAAVAANRPCGAGDYAVAQYRGPYPLAVAGESARSLSQLAVAPGLWPQVTLVDRATNQDGCKGATLTLAYAGSGQGS